MSHASSASLPLLLGLALLSACATPPGGSSASGGASTTGGSTSASGTAAAASSETRATPLVQLSEPGSEPPAGLGAVVHVASRLDGRILPVMHGEQIVSTRADMRRSETAVQFDNWLMRQVGGNGHQVELVRLDRKLLWTLDPAKQSYRECALSGCRSATKPADPKPAKPASQGEAACVLTVKKNELKVASSGEKKDINGFATTRHVLTWTVEVQDAQKRSGLNTVALDLWSTPETGVVREVQRIEQNYGQRWATAMKLGNKHPFERYLPREVMAPLAALNEGKVALGGNWARELKKLKGYPILTTLAWKAEGNACGGEARATPARATNLPPTSLGGLIGSVIGATAEAKVQEASSGPLMSFSHEVKRMAVRPLSDSAFAPPPAYVKEP